MAINHAVLSALVRPRQSVADYEDMYAERDARQQRNALLQMQMAQAKQGMQQQEAVRNAFAQYGTSPQAVNALMSAGAYPEGMKLQEQLAAQSQAAMRRDALKALQPTQAIDANRVSGVIGPRPEALSVVGQKRPFDPAAMLQHFSPDEVAKMQALVDPRVEVKDYKEVRMPDGSVQLVGFGKDGKVVQTGQVPFVKPEVRDFGGYVGGVDLVSGKVQRYGDKTMSAAERDSSARGWAGVNLERERLKMQKDKENAPPKPLPASVVKTQTEALDSIGVSTAINADLGALERQIDKGSLKFGPVSNLTNMGLNMAGASTEESRNFATFQASLERLRNESLRLNSGVQTDGDAQRAWNELFQSINDTKLVKQRLQEIQRINKRAVDLQRSKVNLLRSEYGLPPLDVSSMASAPSALGDAPTGGWSIKPKGQ